MTYRSAATAPVTDWARAVRARRRVGHGIEVHDTIGSTNDRARELLAEGVDGGVVVAEHQSAGRGRRGRAWLSPEGVNLTLSVALRPALAAGDAWQVGLATGLAAFAACGGALRGTAAAAEPALKWPNDVVAADGRKLAGILVETAMRGDELVGAVIGIGMNVNWRVADMPGEIAPLASSLAELRGGELDRVEVLDLLLDALDDEVVGLEAGRSPLARYRTACATLGREVEVATANGTLHGLARDVDEAGCLVLDTPAGREQISAGEVVAVRSGGTS